MAGDQRVSFLVALEYGNNEIEHAAALVPPDATAEPALAEEVTTATASPEAPSPTATVAPTRVPPTAVPPTPGPTKAPPAPVASGAVIQGQATAYGPAYNGQKMGCGGVYSSDNPTILAVSPARYAQWPCGTQLQVCGPAGCLIVTRQDACPGCYANLVDLSEAGNAAVCGSPPHTCRVTLQVVQ
jgi:hypothetical protein